MLINIIPRVIFAISGDKCILIAIEVVRNIIPKEMILISFKLRFLIVTKWMMRPLIAPIIIEMNISLNAWIIECEIFTCTSPIIDPEIANAIENRITVPASSKATIP